MNITETRKESASILKIKGRLDSNTSPEFEDRLQQTIRADIPRIILDFETLSYISSAGLRVILKAAKELKRSGGSLVLCAMPDYVREIFEISGFDTFLPIVGTVADALDPR